mgnify:CR=1 FL=1
MTDRHDDREHEARLAPDAPEAAADPVATAEVPVMAAEAAEVHAAVGVDGAADEDAEALEGAALAQKMVEEAELGGRDPNRIMRWVIFALAIGLTAGIIAAARYGTSVDFGIMTLATLGVSMPGFWVGLMLILVFGVQLGWFPVAGVGGPKYFVLPAFAIGTSAAAVLARLTRSTMLEVLRSDYVRTARAKGVVPRVVLLRHAFRNAFIPVLTIIGLQVGGLLAGSVVVETVFALPGLGRLLVQGVQARDYPLVQGMSVLIAAVYVLVNFLVDVAYTLINPRIRFEP